jgi:uncharacterized membrane protein YheB (UPF0754 family)
MGDIINLVEILEEQEKKKKLQEEMENAELREQLRWVLQKLHEKNITYKEEDEHDFDFDAYEPIHRGNWFRRFLDRFRY